MIVLEGIDRLVSGESAAAVKLWAAREKLALQAAPSDKRSSGASA